MKNLFKKMMLFAAAAMAFASCSNDGIKDEVNTVSGIEVTINATTTEARSVFGDYNSTDEIYPTLWSGNESWKVAIGVKNADVAKENIVFAEDKKGAVASFSINEPEAAESYVLYAVSPLSAYVSSSSEYIRFTIPASQKPIEGSCDEAAQVLLAVSEPKESISSFNVNFEHATAYCKLSFLNVVEGGNVTSVSIAAKDVNIAGRYEYTVATKAIKEQSSLAQEIALTTTNTTDLYFACAPVDVSGKELTFTIHTDNGKLSKTVTMPENRTFKSGVVATLNINMAGIEYPAVSTTEWLLVEDLNDITEGEYVIVDKTKVLPNAKVSNGPGFVELSTKATVGDDILTGVDDSVIWVFTGDNTAMTIQSYVDNGLYLYNTNNNDGVQVNTTSTHKWAFEVWKTGFGMKTNGRYLGVYEDGSDWRSYTTVNASNYGSDGACLTLYKKFSTEPMITASDIQVDEFGVENETASYDVKNMDDDVTVKSISDGWVTASASAKTIKYAVESNYTGKARTAQIVLVSASTGVTKTITVSQDADKFAVSATAITLDAEKDAKVTFTVTSSYEYSVSNPDSSKLSVVKGDNDVITVIALAANELAEVLSIGNIVVSRSVDTKTLNVAVSQKVAEQGGGDEPEQGGTHFVKVTSAPSDWSGTYLIVYEGGKVAFNGSLSTFDAVSNTKSVTISDNKIEATDEMKAIAFTIAKNGSNYSIKGASGKYIGNNSNSNALTTNASAMDNTLAFVSANDITIKGKGGAYLRYNATSGQTRFRYYKSSSYTGQKAIQLYKLN